MGVKVNFLLRNQYGISEVKSTTDFFLNGDKEIKSYYHSKWKMN